AGGGRNRPTDLAPPPRHERGHGGDLHAQPDPAGRSVRGGRSHAGQHHLRHDLPDRPAGRAGRGQFRHADDHAGCLRQVAHRSAPAPRGKLRHCDHAYPARRPTPCLTGPRAPISCARLCGFWSESMAKAATTLIKLVSTAGTGYFYTTKKNARNSTEKLSLKK